MSKPEILDLAPFDASDYLNNEEAIAEYAAEVRARAFPSEEHIFADHAPKKD